VAAVAREKRRAQWQLCHRPLQRSSGLLKRMKILKKALANTRLFD
jgi:hypothetical protein